MKKKNRCSNCGKVIQRKSKRCKKCWGRTIIGEKNPYYKHGKYTPRYSGFCENCGKKLSACWHRLCLTCHNKLNTHTPWNKGLTKKTDKRITRYAKKLKNKKPSKANIEAVRKANTRRTPWNKNLTKETDMRVAKSARKLSFSRKGKYTGPNHWNWQGGKKNEPYSWNFSPELKTEIRKKFSNKCLLCGQTNKECLVVTKKSLAIHHIDYNKKNTDFNNLVPLCTNCHAKTHYNRNFYTEYFKEILGEK